MKATRLITVTLLLTLSGLWCCGQVRVIGHVSAEVVESVSARSNGSMSMNFNGQQLKKFNLGNFSISGTASSTCTLVLDNASIKNSKGESFTIQTATPNREKSLVADQKGNQSLDLVAGTSEILANGQYQGNYGVTFAYN
ncbi:MAG: hypothetical protein HGA37_00925 [Lentimicrobium sp.]|nr:hypothetical protein [Lentimicrobium sp.]